MALSSGAGTIRRRSRKVFRAGPRVLEKAPAPSGPVLYTAELARMSPPDLQEVAADLGIDTPDALTRQDLLYRVLGAHTSQGGRV
ncbi:MAG: hypothetical protein F4228_03370, partial [Acidobacteria bacterium]|nr:hypothetical protein [Acidobacteriota bacterium]